MILNNLEYDFEDDKIQNFVNKNIPEFKKLMKKIDKFVMGEEKKISIYFVNNDTIKMLNKKYRNKDEETDVLSFQLYEHKNKSMGKNRNELQYLGEVIFAPIYFIKKAKNYNENIYQYFLYMVLHSYLHLNGWTHNNEEEYIEFENKTEQLLKKISKEDW